MYSYTNSQAANLYKEVTSASNIIEHNLNNKIIDINRFTGEINAELKDLKDTVGFLPTTESIDKLKENLMNIIEKMELQYSLNLDNLKNDFENQLNNQRLKYEKKLIDMEETIEKLNDDLKALKKNPIERFLVKFGKKTEDE